MNSKYFPLIICFAALLILTGCDGDVGVSPGMTFDEPSATATMLPPPTAAQQVNQGNRPWCAPAAGLTLYRVVTGKDEPLEQVASEMGTTENGTYISNTIDWLVSHEMNVSYTTVQATGAVGMIENQIKNGNYVVPRVHLNGKPDSRHVLIVYAVDQTKGKVYLSDSNRHLGMNRFALDATIFRDQWLNNIGTKESPTAFMVFVNRNPVTNPPAGSKQKADTAGSTEMPYEDLLVK